jgi:hypothetical protein
VFLYLPPAPLVVLVTELARRMADHAARYLDPLSGPWRKLHDEVVAAERARQCHLLREIFGDPFRPVAVDPRWLTSDVRSVARGIYAERAFDGMPILADALQDAGCDAAGVLDHCREPGEHVRGCWVLDLLLA